MTSPVRALVFDMDGTLTDSDPLHLVAFRRALEPFGIPMSEERYRREISGRTNAAIGRMLFPDGTVEEHERFADEKERMFRDLASTLEPLAGLSELLDIADAQGLALALVTNAPRANADHMVAALGLEGRFAVRVLGEEVARQKPDPLPYTTALARLGLRPEEAVAFEDSVSGVRSAAGAGIPTVGIVTSQTPETLLAAGARHAVRDFGDPLVRRLLDGGEPAP